MEPSITRTGGEVIGMTMILIGSALIGAGALHGLVPALIGMLVMLHVTGAFERTTARVTTRFVERQRGTLARRRLRR